MFLFLCLGVTSDCTGEIWLENSKTPGDDGSGVNPETQDNALATHCWPRGPRAVERRHSGGVLLEMYPVCTCLCARAWVVYSSGFQKLANWHPYFGPVENRKSYKKAAVNAHYALAHKLVDRLFSLLRLISQ